MGWKEILQTEIRLPLPGIPKGRLPRFRRRAPIVSWYAQQAELDRRAVLVQVAAIVATNGPLPGGLRACAEDAPNREVRNTLVSLAEAMASGSSLGEAMMESGGFFKPEWTGLVLAAERTGSVPRALDSILKDVNEDIDAAHLSRNRIAYFAFLIVVQSVIMSFVLVRIFPIFTEVLWEFAAELPGSVAIFEALREAIVVNHRLLLVILAVLAGVALFGRFIFRLSGFVQRITSAIVLPLPVLGGYYRAHVLRAFSSMMRLLIGGGMPLPDALRQAARGGLPEPYGAALRWVAEAVSRGDSLSEALAGFRRLFGARFIELIRFGEGREDLAGAFAQAGDLNRRRVLRRRRALTDALVPLGVAVCGSGVLLVSLSLYAMLAAISDTISSDF